MKFTSAKTLRREHEALHDGLCHATEALVEHAQSGQAVMYPAAILVGPVVLQRLGVRATALA